MTDVPVISIFGSAIKVHDWLKFYEKLSHNDVSFVIIFAGHVRPDFELPSNFKYIYASVKPAQCFHIAYSNTSGKYVLNSPDDFEFSPHALDNMLSMLQQKDENKTIVTSRYFYSGVEIPLISFRDSSDIAYYPPSGIVVSFGSLVKKNLFEKLGGIDNRFLALYWDLDIVMQLYVLGGKVIICENATCDEPIKNSLHKLRGKYDFKFFLNLWCKTENGQKILTLNRNSPVAPFINDESILSKSQGYAISRWP